MKIKTADPRSDGGSNDIICHHNQPKRYHLVQQGQGNLIN